MAGKSVLCWCGAKMLYAGKGAFPYDCIARDKYPDADVYQDCEAGHHCWTYEKSIHGLMANCKPLSAPVSLIEADV